MFAFMGCNSNNKSIEAINKENSELKQKILQLGYEKKELTTSIESLQRDSKNKQSNPINDNEVLNLTKKEARTLREELANNSKKNKLMNMFNPFNLKVSDKVGSFTVKSVNINSGLENVSFEGSFSVTGDLITNIMGSSDFSIIVSKNEFYKLPYSIHQIDNDAICIDINNSKDEIISALGGIYKEPEGGNEFKINVRATFSEYNYRFKDETDIASRAKLLNIISISK